MKKYIILNFLLMFSYTLIAYKSPGFTKESGIIAAFSIHNYTFLGQVNDLMAKRKYNRRFTTITTIKSASNQWFASGCKQPVKNDQRSFETLHFPVHHHNNSFHATTIHVPEKVVYLQKHSTIKRLGSQ